MSDDRIRAIARQVASSVVAVSTVTTSSADGHSDEINGPSAEDEPRNQERVRRLWPFGVRSVPPAGVDAVVVRPNVSSIAGVMVGAESAKYGPDDLEVGETTLYNAVAAVLVKLAKDGTITINSDAGNGKDVVINGGTAAVGRVGDTVDAFTIQATFGAGPLTTCIIGLTITPIGGGAPVVIAVATPGPFTLTSFGKIHAGAPHFKA
jgi:phage gp45-like